MEEKKNTPFLEPLATEQEIEHIFELTEKGEYRCLYCETKAN